MLWGKRPHSDPTSLVSRLARGDRQALDLVYRAEGAEVYRYALAMCGNPAWSADATQDAFVQLAEHSAGYDADKGPLRAWLCGIARHKLLARWRDARGDAPPADEDEEEDGAGAVPGLSFATPEGELARSQGNEALWRAIRELPWAFREAVVLVDLQERSYAEAAQIAGVELNTLRTRLHRARQRLAQSLSPMFGELQHE
jgi:RNA polymerase sigma-70 factor (ECF subfamily)